MLGSASGSHAPATTSATMPHAEHESRRRARSGSMPDRGRERLVDARPADWPPPPPRCRAARLAAQRRSRGSARSRASLASERTRRRPRASRSPRATGLDRARGAGAAASGRRPPPHDHEVHERLGAHGRGRAEQRRRPSSASRDRVLVVEHVEQQHDAPQHRARGRACAPRSRARRSRRASRGRSPRTPANPSRRRAAGPGHAPPSAREHRAEHREQRARARSPPTQVQRVRGVQHRQRA